MEEGHLSPPGARFAAKWPQNSRLLIFRKYFAGDQGSTSGTGDDARALAQQLAEVKDFLTLFHGALVGFTDQLPELPWGEDQVVSFIGRRPPRKAKPPK